jgi:hypothetical protein
LGPFNQIARFPLAEATHDELRAYRFPFDHADSLLARMEPLLASGEEYL